jgi:hypothetical protein
LIPQLKRFIKKRRNLQNKVDLVQNGKTAEAKAEAIAAAGKS